MTAQQPKVTRRKITDYLPDDHNANLGSERGLQMLESSLNEDGAGRSIVVDAHDKIPAGNKTLEAAVLAGIEDVIEIETDGKALIVHKRTDWDLDDPIGAARRYAYRDNRTSEVSLTWDANVIAADVEAGVDLSGMFTQPELDHLFNQLNLDSTSLTDSVTPEQANRTLAERFGVPPFSVLDARQGYWQERKRAWLALGLQSELGRGSENLSMSHPYTTENKDFYTQKSKLEAELNKELTSAEAVVILRERGLALKSQREVNTKRIQGKLPADSGGQPLPLDRMKNGKTPARTFAQDLMRGEGVINSKVNIQAIGTQSKIASVKGEDFTGLSANQSGTSIFDPVLCELAYRWFSPPDGSVLDPFAGGSVRGIVAHKLGRTYTGIDLRAEQIAANEAQAAMICKPVDLPEMVTVKLSAKSANQLFNGCDPDYIKNVCHASCCQSSTSETGTMITIHPSEIPIIEARGGIIKAGLLQPRVGEKRCPFKTDDELCGLHFTPDKPFGCIASPFTLNNNNTLIVRNRYRMLRCYNDGKRIPAYKAFRASLDLIFGKEEAQRICEHLEAGGGDITAEMSRHHYLMLKDNDDIKHGRLISDVSMPRWITGDSCNISALLPDEQFDYVFSCPPYFDLEIYSDTEGDLSNAGDYQTFIASYRAIIAACMSKLKDDRFACFVVGDVRGKKGMYRNFVSDTIAAFQDAGAKLYNEAILVTSVGSLPIRVGKQFESGRKLGKTHQNVLVFIKGDPKKATAACGEIDVYYPDELESADEIGSGGDV